MRPDKKKIVFISIIIIVLLFIVSYTMLVFMEEEVLENLQQPAIPELQEEQETYTSKIEALDAIKEDRERSIPSVYSEKYLDSLDAYAPAIEDERERMVDSIIRFGILEPEGDFANKEEEEKVVETIETENNLIEPRVTLADLSAGHANFFLSAVTSEATSEHKSKLGNKIKAKVNGTQTLRSGDRLELILSEDAIINEKNFPKNSLLYGFVSFQLNRLLLKINHLNGVPVSVKAFDLQDSNEGIYLRNSFRAEAGREVLDDIVQDINIAGFPQIGGVKNIFRKNNRNLKVTILDQYQIILKPEQ